MTPLSRNNIELRAARYFGMERFDRRTSIKVGRYKVIVVRPHGRASGVGIYSEEGREPTGQYLYLDGDKSHQLAFALEEHR